MAAQAGFPGRSRALDGEAAPGRDVRHYVHRDGRTTDGTTHPTWWHPTTSNPDISAHPNRSMRKGPARYPI